MIKLLHLPPVYFVLTSVSGLLIHRFVFQDVFSLNAIHGIIGILVMGAGLLLDLVSVVNFLRRKTGVIPFSKASVLVTNWTHRLTRNPMYLGLLLIQSGVMICLAAYWGCLIIPVYWSILHFLFVLPEERYLKTTFGESYAHYQKSTRRWL